MSSRHVFKTCSIHVFKTSSKRLQGNNFSSFKTSSRSVQNVFARCLQEVFKTSSRRPGRRKSVTLKTWRRRLQDITWRRFEDVLKTNKCLLGCFKLHYCIARQTNCINLNKPNTLKHGNNAENVKTWFSMNCQTEKYFLQELKYFFSIEVSHTVALLGLLLLKWKTFPKMLL